MKICILILILIFPLVSFKIHIQSPIFPAIEIIIAYYFLNSYKVKNIESFLYGLVIDQVNLMPLGHNSLAFLCGNVFLILINKVIISKKNIVNVIIFAGYALTVLALKYLMLINRSYSIGISNVLLQFTTTIITYLILKILLMSNNYLFNNRH